MKKKKRQAPRSLTSKFIGWTGRHRKATAVIAIAIIGTALTVLSLAATTTLTFNGRLSSSQPSASYRVASEQTGTLTATATFPGSMKNTTLELVDSGGVMMKRVSGRSPITLSSPVDMGNYTIRINTEGKGNYKLEINYPTKDLADSTKPTIPGSLTASIDSTNVNLQWLASTDNVALSGYYIERDGQRIASVTPDQMTYSDLALANGTYTYTVIAFDTSNNTSGASNQASATVNYVVPSPVSGSPTTTAKGSFVERPCTRSYKLSGMQLGSSGDAVYNGDRFRNVLNSAAKGDCILVDPGLYRLAGNVDFNVAGITLKGLGAIREDVFFEHVTETRAIFMVKAADVHFYNFTHRVYASARSSLGQSGEGNIWAQGGHSGFRMQDILAWGSRDSAIFTYGITNFQYNRVESRDSKSDAFHITNGSSYGTLYDCISRNSGDDGIGIVAYGSEGPGTSHHMTVVRHSVHGQSWGRGIGLIHVNNVSIHGPTLIEGSAGAALIIAREPGYGSGSVRTIRVHGELRLRKSNQLSTIGHGAILINNPDTVAPIEDVIISGPIVIADTRSTAPNQIRVFGQGKIQAEIGNAQFYGTGPSSLLLQNLAAGSTLSIPGWSPNDGYRGTEPVYPL